MKNVLLVAALLIFGCSSDEPAVTAPNPPANTPAPSVGGVLYHNVYGIDLYVQIKDGSYRMMAPGQIDVTGTYQTDSWGNVILDGAACGGITAPYHIQQRGSKAYLTSADYCERHFYVTGEFEIVSAFPASDAGKSLKTWKEAKR